MPDGTVDSEPNKPEPHRVLVALVESCGRSGCLTSASQLLESCRMAELDRTTLKSEIVAELVAYLSLHPEVFDVLEHAPWQTSRIWKVERAVCELKEWR